VALMHARFADGNGTTVVAVLYLCRQCWYELATMIFPAQPPALHGIDVFWEGSRLVIDLYRVVIFQAWSGVVFDMLTSFFPM